MFCLTVLSRCLNLAYLPGWTKYLKLHMLSKMFWQVNLDWNIQYACSCIFLYIVYLHTNWAGSNIGIRVFYGRRSFLRTGFGILTIFLTSRFFSQYIGSKETDQKADQVLGLRIMDVWTPENHYRWSRSRYGGHVSASVESVTRSQLLLCSTFIFICL